jgi:hypothetical protein
VAGEQLREQWPATSTPIKDHAMPEVWVDAGDDRTDRGREVSDALG